MPSIRPSTCAGTPVTMSVGGVPSRAGQLARTRSWFAPMPPEVTITAWADSSNAPTSVREVATPRAASDGSRTAPETPVTTPSVLVRASTLWRKRSSTSPARSPSRTIRANGATRPGPVPQVTWNRGTELPCPSAR